MAHIKLDDVEIAFAQTDARSQSLKQLAMSVFRGRKASVARAGTVVRALRNVTLEFKDGDRVGLLGRNGAGKSTLLRVLSGVYDPHIGHVRIEGRTASLLSLGLGFFPDLTGKENILTSSMFYGPSRSEALARCDDIAAFTELSGSLDRPIRTYSAGMQMRLAFGVATAFDPEILLLDEVVGVGDHAFAARAAARIEALVGAVKILVLASHDEAALRRFCTRGIVLNNGEIKFDGRLDDAIKSYHSMA